MDIARRSFSHRRRIGGDAITWLLRDEFLADLAAGAVNGTPATPGPGTRVVIDTDGDALSVGSGVLQFANPNSVWADPALWYGAMTRVAGRVLIARVTVDATDTGKQLGWDTNQAGEIKNLFEFRADGTLQFRNSDLPGRAVAVYTATTYHLAIVLRAAGMYGFIEGGAFTNWTLLWVSRYGSTATLYPAIETLTSVWSSGFFRIPDVLWLPTPIAYDTFTRADGALGSSEILGPESQDAEARAWESGGATWAIASNEAVNSPVAGGELCNNGEFTVDTAGWSPGDGATLTRRDYTAAPDIDPTGGADDFGLEVASGGSVNSRGIFTLSTTVGTWLQFSCRVYSPSANVVIRPNWARVMNTSDSDNFRQSTEDVWETLFKITRATTIAPVIWLYCKSATAGDLGHWDIVTVKPLTLTDLITCVETSTANVVAQVELDTVVAGTQAGLVLNLDDKDTPANFVIAYHDGTNAKLDKCVAGTYTSVISAAATYAAGATLLVVKDGTSYSLFYNNAKIGATSTISDAGIISNTKHGLFSTYSGNQLDNFLVMPRGTGNEFSALDKWSS